MAFDGSGNYVPAAAPNFPAVSGQVISSVYFNAVINDLCTNGLSQVLTRDGQGKPSASINWNGQNITNLNAITATTGTFTNATITNLTLGTIITLAQGGTGLATVPTNGQLLIGNGTNYTLATLVGGSGITVTNSAGGISIAVASGGGTVISVSGGTTGHTFSGTTALTLAGTLVVANGGTGTTTSTGTGNTVLSASPTFTGAPVVPTASTVDNSTTIASTAFVKAQAYVTSAAALTSAATVSGNLVGYLDLAGSTQAGTYTLVLGDRGQTIFQGGNLTIPANASVAFPIRTVITIIATAGITISITTDTLTLAGTATTGTRTMIVNSIATIVKVTTTGWIITGSVT